MVVECPTCHAKYNVDENKVPPAGVKVRCHKCQNIVVIKKPAPPPVIEPVAPPVVEPVIPKPEPEPIVQQPTIETPQPQAPSFPEPEPPKIPEPMPGPPQEPEPAAVSKPPEPEFQVPAVETPAPPEIVPPTAFQEPAVTPKPAPAPAAQLSEEDKKWHERAKRLAKALASDLVLYNQAKVEQGLRDGTLVQLLGSEIRRSWEYYCQQIPKHIVDSTDYFKEQLNKVVGKGKELFK